MHKFECLNRRDRYMIGDFVLRNGKLYQWTAADYNRTQKGMEEIDDIPFTLELVKAVFKEDDVYDYALELNQGSIYLDLPGTAENIFGQSIYTTGLIAIEPRSGMFGEGGDIHYTWHNFTVHQFQHTLRDWGFQEFADTLIYNPIKPTNK